MSQTNESATVPKTFHFSELNKALVSKLLDPYNSHGLVYFQNILQIDTVAISFVFDKYYLIID